MHVNSKNDIVLSHKLKKNNSFFIHVQHAFYIYLILNLKTAIKIVWNYVSTHSSFCHRLSLKQWFNSRIFNLPSTAVLQHTNNMNLFVWIKQTKATTDILCARKTSETHWKKGAQLLVLTTGSLLLYCKITNFCGAPFFAF